MPHADLLAARLYRLALQGKVPHESFLEEVLAAALEHPEVWPRLRALGEGWGVMPAETPRVRTQHSGESGRTDLLLTWQTGAQLVIELKPWLPPSSWQLEKYLRDLPGAWATAIAFQSRKYDNPRVLPMLSWRALRAESWPEAPQIWRQLHHLIDAIGVEMKNLEETTLRALVPSWDAWGVLESWMRPLLSDLPRQLEKAGLPAECKTRQRVDQSHRRHGFWIWLKSADSRDEFGLFFGISFGSEQRPLIEPGIPDLRWMLHLNPETALAGRLRDHEAFTGAAQRWCGRPGDVLRQHDPRLWSLLDARQPLSLLTGAASQGDAFRGWITERFQEMSDDGIFAALGA